MNALASVPFADFPAPHAPETLRTVLVEPNVDTRVQLCELIARMPGLEVTGMCANFREALEQMTHLAPELIVLDWHVLPSVPVWRALPLRPHALIVTADDAIHAVHAFELGAIDFLLKPVDAGRLEAALARARYLLRASRDLPAAPRKPAPPASAPAAPAARLVLKRDGEYHFVAPSDIVRLQAEGDYVKIFTRTGSHLVRSTLTRLCQQLDPRLFLRVHRSHVVNRDYVTKAALRPEGDYSLTLAATGTVPVARAQTDLVRRLLA